MPFLIILFTELINILPFLEKQVLAPVLAGYFLAAALKFQLLFPTADHVHQLLQKAIAQLPHRVAYQHSQCQNLFHHRKQG